MYFDKSMFHAKPERVEGIQRFIFREDGPSTSTSTSHQQTNALEPQVQNREAGSIVVR